MDKIQNSKVIDTGNDFGYLLVSGTENKILLYYYMISNGKMMYNMNNMSQVPVLRRIEENKIIITRNETIGKSFSITEGFIHKSFWYLFDTQNVYIISKEIENFENKVEFIQRNLKEFIKCKSDAELEESQNTSLLNSYLFVIVIISIFIVILILFVCLYCCLSAKSGKKKKSFVLKRKSAAKTNSKAEEMGSIDISRVESANRSSIQSLSSVGSNDSVFIQEMPSTGFNVSRVNSSQPFLQQRQLNDASDISIVRPTDLSVKKKTP
jgi:hypothetical protein